MTFAHDECSAAKTQRKFPLSPRLIASGSIETASNIRDWKQQSMKKGAMNAPFAS
ncbi:hypothetical protein [Paracoccus seriniphilus]|uniref:hypothetical protein n=1 Tax=Paracoccus seriniphilus TaxID=184748 RepID=UPI0023500639|nr:hypothetical protein [Paracoccus seriniphilus]WCR12717.1 hypothetical protein JHW44_06945 [Paracoccus seriniphilus]